MYSLEAKAIEIFAKRMLDVIFRDCITSEGDPNYQTNDAENNVIIEKFEKNSIYICIGDVWWSYS